MRSGKNRNLVKKNSKFWSKIEVLVNKKNRSFHEKSSQESKFWSRIEILDKNRNFRQKSKFWSKIEILVKNQNFGQKSKYDFFPNFPKFFAFVLINYFQTSFIFENLEISFKIFVTDFAKFRW